MTIFELFTFKQGVFKLSVTFSKWLRMIVTMFLMCSVEEVSSGGEEIDEEDEDNFREEQQEVARPNVWTERLSTVEVPEFTSNTGPTYELGAEKQEADFFHQLFPQEIYEKIAAETNRYAIQMQEQRGTLDRSWRPTDAEEVKVYVGMRIYMSVIDLPDIKMYWSEDQFYGNFKVSDIMPRARFEKLSQYLHANDRTDYNRNDPNRDKLHLIRPVLDIVSEKCLESYQPHQNVAVDEAMVKFRGKLAFRQYMPAKPTKYGIKVWARADSTNGYVSQIDVYVGKPVGGQRDVDLGRKVIRKMTKNIEGKHHHVYFDNYFNGVKLHEELVENKLYGCGTVKANAVGLPEPMRQKRGGKCGNNTLKLQPGEFRTWQKGKITAHVWQEKKGRKPVRILASNYNPQEPHTSVKRKQHDGSSKDVPCPRPVKSYNENMNTVDRSDQMRTAYPTTRTSKRWWTYLFWFLVDLAVSNALTLMRESKNHQIQN